jgi:hypothetical protein
MSKENKARKIGQADIDVSGLDPESQKPIQVGKARKETAHLAHMEACRVAKNRKVVNMNYPPADMPLEEIQRFWGEISSEEGAEWARKARNIKVKKNVKPSPL